MGKAKKYYAWFTRGGNEYVVRFKIKGSLRWEDKSSCFMDRRHYVRSVEDLVSYAIFRYGANVRCACLISKSEFDRYRIEGTPRFKPENPCIFWST